MFGELPMCRLSVVVCECCGALFVRSGCWGVGWDVNSGFLCQVWLVWCAGNLVCSWWCAWLFPPCCWVLPLLGFWYCSVWRWFCEAVSFMVVGLISFYLVWSCGAWCSSGVLAVVSVYHGCMLVLEGRGIRGLFFTKPFLPRSRPWE